MGREFPDLAPKYTSRWFRHGIGYTHDMSRRELNERLHVEVDRATRRTLRRFWLVLAIGVVGMRLLMSFAA